MKSFIVLILFTLSMNLSARGSSSAITFFPYFQMGYINPVDVNDTLRSISTSMTEVPTASVKWNKSAGAFLGYRFYNRYNVGFVFDYTKVGASIIHQSNTAFSVVHPDAASGTTAKIYEHLTGITSIGIGPAMYYTVYNRGKLAIDLGLTFLYVPKVKYFADSAFGDVEADLNKSTNLEQREGSGSTYAVIANVSTAYYFTNYLGASIDLSYRYYGNAGINDPAGTALPFIEADGTQNGTMGISLSGFYFGASLRGEFNFGGTRKRYKPKKEPKEEDKWLEEAKEEPKEEDLDWSIEEETKTEATTYISGGPSIAELRELKKQTQGKWHDARKSSASDSKVKSKRYERLYDIINRLEKNWDHFTAQSKKEKIEKIITILNY
jgi:hypothetical protein